MQQQSLGGGLRSRTTQKLDNLIFHPLDAGGTGEWTLGLLVFYCRRSTAFLEPHFCDVQGGSF